MAILHTSTLLTRSLPSILSHISQLNPLLSSHPSLFTLSASPSTHQDVLENVVREMAAYENAVGCLSAALNTPKSRSEGEYIACSIAVFDKKSAVPFRSEIRGRAEPRIGRWHPPLSRIPTTSAGETSSFDASKLRDDGMGTNWDDVWSTSTEPDQLPEAIQGLDLHTILFLTDAAHEGFSASLSSLRNTTKLGLVASSTPFITGRPFTLFHGSAVHSSGAVGICLTSPPSPKSTDANDEPSLDIQFPSLRALSSEPLRVTQSEGNLVHALNDSNPSRLLLSAIQRDLPSSAPATAKALDAVTKDAEFYLGTLNPSGDSQGIRRLYRIISGDPSRGSLAVEGDTAPPEGSLIQMYYATSSDPRTLSGDLTPAFPHGKSTARSIEFMCSSDAAGFSDLGRLPDEGEDTFTLEDTFYSASENGLVVGRGGEESTPWRCTLAGTTARLEWR